MERKDEFVNTTQGWIGAVQFKRTGEEHGVAVEPGGRVWLTADEQVATANAPQHPKDNPFMAQPFTHHDPLTGEIVDEGVAPPLKLVTEARELAGMRPTGSFAAGDTGHAAS